MCPTPEPQGAYEDEEDEGPPASLAVGFDHTRRCVPASAATAGAAERAGPGPGGTPEVSGWLRPRPAKDPPSSPPTGGSARGRPQPGEVARAQLLSPRARTHMHTHAHVCACPCAHLEAWEQSGWGRRRVSWSRTLRRSHTARQPPTGPAASEAVPAGDSPPHPEGWLAPQQPQHQRSESPWGAPLETLFPPTPGQGPSGPSRAAQGLGDQGLPSVLVPGNLGSRLLLGTRVPAPTPEVLCPSTSCICVASVLVSTCLCVCLLVHVAGACRRGAGRGASRGGRADRRRLRVVGAGVLSGSERAVRSLWSRCRPLGRGWTCAEQPRRHWKLKMPLIPP